MFLENGRLLLHYRVLSHLGAGGMGEVYLAEDLRLGRKLALKIVSARLARDEDRLQRFQWEARSVSALNHPNVITIYDIGEADGHLAGGPVGSPAAPSASPDLRRIRTGGGRRRVGGYPPCLRLVLEPGGDGMGRTPHRRAKAVGD